MKTPDERDHEQRQRSYVRADVQRGERQSLTQYGPERIGRSTPKPVRLVHQRCRIRTRCSGDVDLEPLRRQMGLCQACALHMRATKRADQSIAAWLREQGGQTSETVAGNKILRVPDAFSVKRRQEGSR